MINRHKIAAAAAIVLALGMILNGCGASGGMNNSYSTVSDTENYAYSEPAASDKAVVSSAGDETAANSSGTADQSLTANRKLTRSMSFSAETEDLDDFESRLTKQVADAGGYIENSSRSAGDQDNYYPVYSGTSDRQTTQTGSYSVRIPEEKLDSFAASVKGEVNVLSQSSSVEDITLQYNDTDSRRTALRTEQKQLLSMMEKTDNITDLLAIEQQLTDVNAQLADIESQMKLYDNEVAYATVSIDVTEVKEYTPATQTDAVTRMKEGIVHSWSVLLEDLQEFGIMFVICLPFIALWAIVITVVILIIAAIVRHKRGRAYREPKNKSKQGKIGAGIQQAGPAGPADGGSRPTPQE
ncbi:MAG: DUF4349 domain-containing protein [Lachnospiraceae bacterium]|nr:DUF4349 domain-containing protein [Lachnospiraceae bacterium]